MGLFDEALSGMESLSGQHTALYQEVAGLMTQSGGLNGLVRQFEQQGLGGVISGWIGTGANPAISAEQILQVLGQDKIAEIASKVGLSESQVAEGIAKFLPLMVNHVTPNGAPPPGNLGGVESALDELKSKLFAA